MIIETLKNRTKFILMDNAPYIYSLIRGVIKKAQRKKLYKYKTKKELERLVNKHNITHVALLIDGSTDLDNLFSIPCLNKVSLFSMNLNVVDSMLYGIKVKVLDKDNITEDFDAWIVSSYSSLYGYSLNHFLYENDLEEQFVFYHMKSHSGTNYYSYVDYFSDGQKTNVHINNYYYRLYNIYYPINLKLTLRDLNGKIHKCWQIIIPANCSRTIKSSEISLSNFVGYLEVEYEIHSNTMPFLHYMVDYVSDKAISSNHQSGLGLHPPKTKFIRGYIPEEEGKTLEVCFFQKNYVTDVLVNAILYYSINGKAYKKEKFLPKIKQYHMFYQDIKKLFYEINFTEVKNPRVVFWSDSALHRPNFYYKKYGEKGYYDTSHSAASPENRLSQGVWGGNPCQTVGELSKLEKMNIEPMDLRLFVFDDMYQIDTVIAISDESTLVVDKVKADVFDCHGRLVHSLVIDCWYDKVGYVNLSEQLRRHDIKIVNGSISLRAVDGAGDIPAIMTAIGGYTSCNNNFFTTTLYDSTNIGNIPFYYRCSMPSYLLSETSLDVTDVFCRGVSNDEFDTFLMIVYHFPGFENNKSAEIEIEILNEGGIKKTIYRNIIKNGGVLLKLSELIIESEHNSLSGYYTIWFRSIGVNFLIQHLLLREFDKAISLEHTYVGKYGM
jgi:hypothetical protein